jgi:hypothetical protein
VTGSIPPEIRKLKALTELWLHSNKVTGTIPPEIGELTAMRSFYVNGNKLTGAIPGTLTLLKQTSFFFAPREPWFVSPQRVIDVGGEQVHFGV